ncbi:Protein-disulfide isomerase [Polaromonas sp. OV174]|uniref:DsbA family protein n=1 Tax=Polaromonas sp. OV174 TaxID=1855300 RepID=UPI0008E0DDA8|nr:thioredoxin domain-containing protein [Polaromonas sp. OV174]SFB75462.1 Protein-disulfide isomerase [Polaromonas sp. OV174]
MNKKILVLVVGALVVLGFSLGIYVYQDKQAQTLSRLAQESNSVFNRPHAPVYGSPTAKVRIVEFFDPACETCRAFYPLVKKLVDERPGQVQLLVRQLPLHHGSDQASRILEAARLQGLFWPVTEAVLRAQPLWASHDRPQPELIWSIVENTGLNIRKAKDDVATPQVQASLDQDMADAKTLNVTLTPGFFVNGKPLSNFGHAQLKALVDAEIESAYPQ